MIRMCLRIPVQSEERRGDPSLPPRARSPSAEAAVLCLQRMAQEEALTRKQLEELREPER